MPTADVDAAAIIAALARHNVLYVVIGGFAAELHGVAIPPTRDVDITPATTDENLENLARTLRELNARFRVPDGPPEGIDIPGGITAAWIAGMVTMTLVTDQGALDISLRPDGTAGYLDLLKSMRLIDHEGHAVPVTGLADVIRSKEAAGREKDLRVLPALRAHLQSRSTD